MKPLVKPIAIAFGALSIGYALVVIAFSLPAVKQGVSEAIQSRLSDAYGIRIEWSGIKTVGLTRLKLSDVQLEKNNQSLATIQTVSIGIRPLFIFNGFAGVRSVTMDGVKVTVHRSKEGQTSFKNVFKSSGGLSMPALSIRMTNVSGDYVDETGWGKDPQPFRHGFNGGAVSIDTTTKGATFKGTIKLNESDATARMDGHVRNGNFLLNFDVLRLPTDRWSPYLIPIKKIQVGQHNVNVSGQLSKTKTDKPMTYQIDVAFSDADVIIYTYPFTHASGRVHVTNLGGHQLQLHDVTATQSGIPLRGSGGIHFQQKNYQLSIKPSQAVNLQGMAWPDGSMFSRLSGQLMFDAQLLGSFSKPYLDTSISAKGAKIADITLGDVHLNVMSKSHIFTVTSTPSSDVQVSGNIINNHMAVDFFPIDIQVPAIKQSIPLRIELNGDIKSPMVIATMDKNIPIFGYTMSKVRLELEKKAEGWGAKDATIDLKNGQSLTVDIHCVDFNDCRIIQQGLSKANANVYPRISAMSSDIQLKKIGRQWEVNASTNIQGVGANAFGIRADTYHVSFIQRAKARAFHINQWQLGSQKITGKVMAKNNAIDTINLSFSNVDLSALDQSLGALRWYGWNLHGTATGQLFTKNKQRQQLAMQMQIQGLRSTHGQFGDVNVVAGISPNHIDIQSLQLTGLHDAAIQATITNEDDFTVRFGKQSQIQLEALDIFSNEKLFGRVELSGTLGKKQSKWVHDLHVKSSNLQFDGIQFDHLLSSSKSEEQTIQINDLQLGIDGGILQFKGSGPNVVSSDQLTPGITGEFSFKHVDLGALSKLYQSYQRSSLMGGNRLVLNGFNFNQRYAFHQYQLDNVSLFNAIQQQVSDGLAKPLITGRLNGAGWLDTDDLSKSFISMSIEQFGWNNIRMKAMTINANPMHSNQMGIAVGIDDLVLKKDTLTRLDVRVAYDFKKNEWYSTSQQLKYRGHTTTNPLIFQYKNQQLMLKGNLKNQSINLISFVLPAIESMQNNGQVSFVFTGPMDRIELVDGQIELRNFRLNFNKNASAFNSSLVVKHADLVVDKGQLNTPSILLEWKGEDTYRRVTRDEKNNQMKVRGWVQLDHLDLVNKRTMFIDYNLQLRQGFFSLNFPQFYSGDVLVSSLVISGKQAYPLTRAGKLNVAETLGTQDEVGPTIQGNVALRDGVFNLKPPSGKKKKPRFMLDLGVTLGPGNYIQGSLFGSGLYNLANHVSLEVDPAVESTPFRMSGTLNAPNMSARIPFFEGRLTIFDGSYELLRPEQQQHYFKETPELISEQYIEIFPKSKQGQMSLGVGMHLRAFRKKIELAPTQNELLSDPYSFPAVGLVIDGDYRDISTEFTVLDYALDSHMTLYPQYEFRGAHAVQLTNQQGSQASAYGLSLIMPTIFTNVESLDFSQLGRQQVNSLVRSSIRPYERRLANRLGIYDLRLDYDFGRRLFSSQQDAFFDSDLLGILVVSNVFNPSLFLNIRTDVNVSSDESSHQRDFKVTQAELKYFVSPNFSFGLKNINEYSDVGLFDPRWTINYGYAF
ncbi:MAG: hypothetical protein ISQ13_03315 [Candidatus Margulisbacteria bacterium]|nr:hypothetical protein [Candidatus Margulisiibacteriota bacterium]